MSYVALGDVSREVTFSEGEGTTVDVPKIVFTEEEGLTITADKPAAPTKSAFPWLLLLATVSYFW